LGIACGAKVPSTPVLRGGSLSWASAGPAWRRTATAMAAKRRAIIMSLPRELWSCGVDKMPRLRAKVTIFGGGRRAPGHQKHPAGSHREADHGQPGEAFAE